MKINDIVSFSKESFFNGAVQTEWFYDDTKVATIAESYVFHGPQYYGVSSKDVEAGAHRLLDTASFAKNLTDKLYSTKPNNSFVMTIAGYGTGKSHLAVCLGALFSGDANISNVVIQNITSADEKIGQYIKEKNTRKNLVIVLNGMNNFNLDAEVLRCARLSLARYGISDDILRKLTKSYSIAKHFVEHMFALCQEKFNSAAAKHGIGLKDTALKSHLLARVEADSKVLNIINEVYEEVNGDKIAWNRGLSAGDVLLALQDELCGAEKPFNKILLLFDEFGRYIEYTAANPTIAGEAALQQIFEAIQTANGKIIFSGFIQSELKAYLSRIEKTANITRYIDRYRTACENLFLSSNFETILANILKKSKPSFDRVVGTAVGKYENFHNKMRSALSRWDRSSVKKGVWTSSDLYNTVILKGCYPMHPITVWMLSSSHQWMQQRSTLAFAAEMFEQASKSEIDGTWLPYVYPVQIVDSGIFNEMLNSEEKGLVSSQYCMLYRDIIVKVGDKLSDLEKTVLKAVLIVNMGRMAFLNKEDALLAIHYCANVSEDEVKHALKSLEEMHGVVAFDDHAKTFDLIAEANGFNEFRRIFAKYRLGVKVSIDDVDEDILSQIGLLTQVDTAFGQDKHISSTEWGFSKRLVSIEDISEGYLRNAITTTSSNCNGDTPRGLLIYAYCHGNSSSEVARVSALYRNLGLINYPIIILFLDDAEGEILAALTVKKALQKFSLADKERFKKHIADQQRSQNNKAIRKFTNCVSQRAMIGDSGLETYSGRINNLCTDCFNRLYTKAVPFIFDGFENKNKSQAKSALVTLCVSLLNSSLTNIQVYSSFTPKDKNRVVAVLSTKSPLSWKVFNDQCQLVEPQHPVVKEIINQVEKCLEAGDRQSVFTLFGKYTLAPYGMNENSLSLLVAYFISYQGNKYLYTLGNEKLSKKHWEDNKGKHKIPEINKIYIQKNPNVDIDVVGDLCKKVLALTNVDQCEQHMASLDALISQEGENDQNKLLVAQAQAYLDAGIRISGLIKNKLDKARAAISEIQQKFSIANAVKIFELIPVITPVIEEGYPFVYTEEYKQSVLKLQIDLKAALDRCYLLALEKSKCKITELSQFKAGFSRICVILRNNNCEEFATATEKRIAELEADLIAQQRYESSLVEVEKDLVLVDSCVKHQECVALGNKLDGWLSFFKNAQDLPRAVADPLCERLQNALRLLDNKKASIIADYSEAIKNIATAGTSVELKRIDQTLDRLSQMQLESEHMQTIVQIRDDIQKALAEIENLPSDIDALSAYISGISYKTNQYCWATIKSCAITKLKGLEDEQEKWVYKFVAVAEDTYKEMSAQQCANWLERTRTVPTFFSNSAIQRYQAVKTLVETRLHASRVEGLIAMYDALTDAEKQAFKNYLIYR